MQRHHPALRAAIPVRQLRVLALALLAALAFCSLPGSARGGDGLPNARLSSGRAQPVDAAKLHYSAAAAGTGTRGRSPAPSSPGSAVGLIMNRRLDDAATSNLTEQPCSPTEASAGNVVVLAGERFAAVSSDGGLSFGYVDPANGLPEDYGGVVEDPSVVYDRAQDLFVWLMAVPNHDSGESVITFRTGHRDDVASGDWDARSIFSSPGERFGDFTVSPAGPYLFLSVNVHDAGGALLRAEIHRLPFADLAGTAPFNYPLLRLEHVRDLRVAEDIDGVGAPLYYCAGHSGRSTLSLLWWNADTNAIGGRLVPLPRTWTTEYSSLTPDGHDWLAGVDGRISAGTCTRSGVLWFAWSAGRNLSQSFPEPYIEIARIDAATGGLLDQPALFSPSAAYAYPALAANGLGEVGVSCFRAGSTEHISHRVGILTGTAASLAAQTGNAGPNNNRWGQSTTIRRHHPQYWLFSTAGYVLQDGGDGPDVVPNYTVFGRLDELGDAYEMDDTRQEARTLLDGVPQNRSIHFTSDVDWATFTLPTSRQVTIETGDDTAEDDTRLWLYDRDGNEVTFNDNDGVDDNARISIATLPAGVYYVKVDENGQNRVIPHYQLRLQTTPGVVRLTPAELTVNESAARGSILALRTGDLDTPGSVDVNSTDGTATAAADFTAIATTLTFDSLVDLARVAVEPVHDELIEPNETLTVSLTNPTPQALGSPSATAVTIVDDRARPAPTHLTASVRTASSARISFVDHCQNETGFLLERRPAGGTFGTAASLPASTGSGATIVYTDPSLTTGITYSYRVRARNSAGFSTPSNTGTVTVGPPAAPDQLTATALSTTKIRVTFRDNTDNESRFRRSAPPTPPSPLRIRPRKTWVRWREPAGSLRCWFSPSRPPPTTTSGRGQRTPRAAPTSPPRPTPAPRTRRRRLPSSPRASTAPRASG
jgi:hypothetical protein